METTMVRTIDYDTFPMKEKYLIDENEYLSEWFIFGEYEDKVDIWADPPGMDVFINVPKEVALELIKVRQAFCQEIVRICNARQS